MGARESDPPDTEESTMNTTTTTATTDYAAAGRAAFAAGAPAVPTADAVVQAAIADLPVGGGAAEIMGEWLAGWHAANVAEFYAAPAVVPEPATVTLTRAALVDLLTTAACLGRDTNGQTRGDVTAYIATYGLSVEGRALDAAIANAERAVTA